MTLATWLTVSRFALAVIVLALLVIGQAVAAGIVIILAGITDYLDGWLARTRGEVSQLGGILDPLADKALVQLSLVGFVASGTVVGIHLIPVAAIFLRDILVNGLREASAGPSATPLKVSSAGKWKTAFQFAALIGLAFLGATPVTLSLLWAVAALTVWTGADYFMTWRQAASKTASPQGTDGPAP